MPTVDLPYKFTPRPYQIPFFRAMDQGKLRAVKVWHRKAGKEKVDWNFMIRETQKRVGNYWYIFPKLTQARKVIWEGIDQDGVSFLDHVPKELLDGDPNSTLMMVRFKNGSTINLIGGDTFDKTSVGGNPVGVVFSEYSLCPPSLWSYIRPILANNGGWAVFNFTPRGENHAFDLFNLAKADPENWFSQILTVDDTKALPQTVIDQERKETVILHGNDSIFRQEYYCDFSVPLAGAYYADQITKAYAEGRVTKIAYEPSFPVDTFWDLGINDKMAIWFAQTIANEIRLIDYYENTGQALPHYFQVMQEKKYVYGQHIAPHDIEVRELSTGKSRRETARNFGIDFKVAPKLSINDGIDAVRNIFNRCWFDNEKCRIGLNCLKSYHKEYDDKRRTYLDNPYHDWSSNGADAFRMLGLCISTKIEDNGFLYNPYDKKNMNRNDGWVHPRFRMNLQDYARQYNKGVGVW